MSGIAPCGWRCSCARRVLCDILDLPDRSAVCLSPQGYCLSLRGYCLSLRGYCLSGKPGKVYGQGNFIQCYGRQHGHTCYMERTPCTHKFTSTRGPQLAQPARPPFQRTHGLSSCFPRRCAIRTPRSPVRVSAELRLGRDNQLSVLKLKRQSEIDEIRCIQT